MELEMEQKPTEDGNIKKTTIEETYDPDGDGQESVTEYIEKKKIGADAKDNEETLEKAQKGEKRKQEEEKIKNTIGKVASGVGNAVQTVASVVPHVASFGLGLGSRELAQIFADYFKNKNGSK